MRMRVMLFERWIMTSRVETSGLSCMGVKQGRASSKESWTKNVEKADSWLKGWAPVHRRERMAMRRAVAAQGRADEAMGGEGEKRKRPGQRRPTRVPLLLGDLALVGWLKRHAECNAALQLDSTSQESQASFLPEPRRIRPNTWLMQTMQTMLTARKSSLSLLELALGLAAIVPRFADEPPKRASEASAQLLQASRVSGKRRAVCHQQAPCLELHPPNLVLRTEGKTCLEASKSRERATSFRAQQYRQVENDAFRKAPCRLTMQLAASRPSSIHLSCFASRDCRQRRQNEAETTYTLVPQSTGRDDRMVGRCRHASGSRPAHHSNASHTHEIGLPSRAVLHQPAVQCMEADFAHPTLDTPRSTLCRACVTKPSHSRGPAGEQGARAQAQKMQLAYSPAGGVFSARLTFPASYPLEPPTMRFEPPIFHPNVYADGLVCISILHAPGDDPNMYESSSERWSPVQSIEKILLSVLSMLAEPNVESGANIDACVSGASFTLPLLSCRSHLSCFPLRPQKMYRDNREGYEKIIRDSVKEQLGL
ncbi:hypothetical protein L1887_61000 [Cichorium endivia]|nr:hypothetical protein L1887_61000 [Cichorium endivia]